MSFFILFASQNGYAQEGATINNNKTTLIGINPIFPLFDVFSAEFGKFFIKKNSVYEVNFPFYFYNLHAVKANEKRLRQFATGGGVKIRYYGSQNIGLFVGLGLEIDYMQLGIESDELDDNTKLAKRFESHSIIFNPHIELGFRKFFSSNITIAPAIKYTVPQIYKIDGIAFSNRDILCGALKNFSLSLGIAYIY